MEENLNQQLKHWQYLMLAMGPRSLKSSTNQFQLYYSIRVRVIQKFSGDGQNNLNLLKLPGYKEYCILVDSIIVRD